MNKALVIGIILLIVVVGVVAWYAWDGEKTDDIPNNQWPSANGSSSLSSDGDVFNEMDSAVDGIGS